MFYGAGKFSQGCELPRVAEIYLGSFQAWRSRSGDKAEGLLVDYRLWPWLQVSDVTKSRLLNGMRLTAANQTSRL